MSKLTIDDIEVPPGMIQAAKNADSLTWRGGFAAALLWLSENPIVPSKEEAQEIRLWWHKRDLGIIESWQEALAEWQRRMFLRKPAALPEEVKKLLWDADGASAGTLGGYPYFNIETYNDRIRQAYELGKAGAK